ncbi:unnamed protein product [Caenorhabditis bovis]|uniref:ubiquitinyl hydrolase 1 n=1 Tax=Caenorhabditis bovis TaxID=2654633 RepID=A0A8S1FEA8_9PELO|nr:unnamed protein product [Caenorhabditis bovis]
MRKQEDGTAAPYSRLSSSCSSIRSTNYSVQRPSYTSSMSSYKPSSYTPGSRLTTTSHEASSPLPSRSRTSYSSTSSSTTPSSLSRTLSSSRKTLYTSPAAARASVSAADNLTTSSYGTLGKYKASNLADFASPSSSSTRSSLRSRAIEKTPDHASTNGRIDLGPTTRSNMVHPTSSHIRSRSTSYRTINVSQFTQQARERADREEKDRQYREWCEREMERESVQNFDAIISPPTPSTAVNDFKRAVTSTSSYRPSYARADNNVVASSYSAVAPTIPPPGYSSSSTLLRSRHAPTETDYRTVSPTPSASPAPPPPPPPPPPPSTSSTNSLSISGGARIPRSMSAAVIGATAHPPDYAVRAPYKPMAKVSPYDDDVDRGCVVPEGFTGLRNIGNTCFMNSVLQMLVNNIELREFFLKDHYKIEINESNPLGSQGRLAQAFADFMKQMWSGMHKAIEPTKIKEIVAEKASQFANFAQHDAHEFLSFLLDGLHEDVNRVKKKPLTGTVDSDGRHDIDVSNEAWHNHILRNDSIFVDLFHGQLKSHVQCPRCDKISITFDPFVYLPVPFPKLKKTHNVYFWPLDMQAKPIKITVSYSNEGTIADMLSAVGGAARVSSRNLRAIEAFGHRINKIFANDEKASDIGPSDVIYVFQIHDEADCNEEIVVLYTIQRQLFPNSLRYMCNECGTAQGKLKACDACYNAYYCSKECQLNNWSSGGHRDDCRRRPTSDVVGQPLIVSFPRSQLTYSHLYRVLEAKARHTVTIFQQPQYEANQEEGSSESDALALPTSTMRTRSGVGAPPSFQNAATTRSTDRRSEEAPKRQSVLAEPRSKTEKMFDVRKLNTSTDSFGEVICEATPVFEKIRSGSYISINWINLRFGKEYITVGNRAELDIDVDKSRLLCSASSNSIEKASRNEAPKLTQMLDLFSETERLKPEESWYCSSCKEHVEATKKLQLYRLPPILIIQLKRFVYTAFTHQSSLHRRSKDERTVEYPLENLDMSPFLAETAPPQASTTYDLTGVVCHNGSSYFGHYISMGRLADFDSRKSKIDWRQFDDSMVTRQSASNLHTDDAYLLFYKLRDSQATRQIFKKHYSCDPGDNDDEIVEKM